MKKDSKTLREFSVRVTDKNGNKHVIRYGYDMSGKHSGHYITLSTNGSTPSSNKKAIKKIQSFKIPALTHLTEAIDRDVTGTPIDYENSSETIVNDIINHDNDADRWDTICNYYRIETAKEEQQLASMLDKYRDTTERQQDGILSRYNKTRRIAFLNDERELIASLRTLYNEGTEVNGTKIVVKFEGDLKKSHYPYYYKRDIDYIRKARVRVYENILGREYVPYQG